MAALAVVVLAVVANTAEGAVSEGSLADGAANARGSTMPVGTRSWAKELASKNASGAVTLLASVWTHDAAARMSPQGHQERHTYPLKAWSGLPMLLRQ